MSRWPKGATVIERLLEAGSLQSVRGAEADGSALLAKAERTLATAAAVQNDPDSTYTLAYDAARFAGTALLAHQGLRPTTGGGHYAVEEALRAQFGDVNFRPFGAMRRRRNELEYPQNAASEATPAEAGEALQTARELIDAAGKLLPMLSFF